MRKVTTTRRDVLAGLSGAALAGTASGFAPRVAGAAGPVTLNIIDVAGNLQLTQEGIEKFRTLNPGLVSRITFSRAPSPELPAKLKAMQTAGRVDIDLVLTGPGALSDGVEQGLWTALLPAHAAALPKLEATYHEAALAMQTTLDWWNFEDAVAGFFVHCLAIVGLYIAVTYYAMRWTRHLGRDAMATPAKVRSASPSIS